ncbi:MAG: GNAT family N-acetyltransferase [Candidatus Eremiobacterota bacterium]
MTIRAARAGDAPAILSIFRPILAEGTTYAYDPDTPDGELVEGWMGPGRHAFVAEEDGQVLGSYTLRPNFPGRGSHVANGSYIVGQAARGRGVGRRLGEHSLVTARELGFHALQFNLVVSTNTAAVDLWKKLGFEVVGRLPEAFRHPDAGLVDALVMFRKL